MECKKCGTTFEGNICPNCNEPSVTKKPKKSIFKKWWFWLIAVIVVVAVANSSGGEGTTTPTTPTNSNPTTSTTATENTNQQEETSPTTEPASNVDTSSDNKYNVGDVINANGLKITYVSAEKWESSNMFLQPKDGYMYIRLNISAENTSSTDRYISSFEFECYADGKKEEASYLGDNGFTGGTLSSGRRSDGYIYFEVPVNANSIEVEYETSFWTDKKAILVVALES